MEHGVFVQERILGMLRNQLRAAPAGPAQRDYGRIDEITIALIPNRLAKFKAPEFLNPKGGMKLSEALDGVVSNTRQFTDFLGSTPDLRGHLLESPPLKAVTNGEYGVMDGYQWILAIAGHTERQAKQIVEVKAHPNFPAN